MAHGLENKIKVVDLSAHANGLSWFVDAEMKIEGLDVTDQTLLFTKGYDCFFYEPREYNKVYCFVCGTVCHVIQNVDGPISYEEASEKKGHIHDHFYCPYFHKDWHRRAVSLVHKMNLPENKQMRKMISQDLRVLLDTEGPGCRMGGGVVLLRDAGPNAAIYKRGWTIQAL